jgi:four helix bundle protein
LINDVQVAFMMPYERFRAWKLCHELTLQTYRVTKLFPREEQYGLVSQARRAAFSAAVNIVEGSTKRGRAEFRRFLDISLASLAELSYIFRLAADLGYGSPREWKPLVALRQSAAVVTWKLYDSLREGPHRSPP